MTGSLFFPFDPAVAAGFAALVLILVFIYRRAHTIGARFVVYALALVLVVVFLLLFAPR